MTWILEFYKRNPPVVWEMFKFVRPRELAFVPIKEWKEGVAHRFINVFDWGLFLKALEGHYKTETRWNLFASIQYVKKVYDDGGVIRLKTTWLVWGWDIVIDLDADPERGLDIWDAWAEALAVCDLYDEYGLLYWVKFSGGRGFHVTVPWRFRVSEKEPPRPYLQALFNPIRDFNQPPLEVARRWAVAVSERLRLRTMDASTTYKHQGLIRVPYSIHPRTGLVALPLSRSELERFDPEVAKLERVAKMDVRTRGLQMRNGGDQEEALEGLREFIRGVLGLREVACDGGSPVHEEEVGGDRGDTPQDRREGGEVEPARFRKAERLRGHSHDLGRVRRHRREEGVGDNRQIPVRQAPLRREVGASSHPPGGGGAEKSPKCPYCGSEDTKLMWCFIEGVEIRYVYRCRRCGRYIKVGKEAGA